MVVFDSYLPCLPTSERMRGLGLLGKPDVHGKGDPNVGPFAGVLPVCLVGPSVQPWQPCQVATRVHNHQPQRLGFLVRRWATAYG